MVMILDTGMPNYGAQIRTEMKNFFSPMILRTAPSEGLMLGLGKNTMCFDNVELMCENDYGTFSGFVSSRDHVATRLRSAFRH